MPLHRRSTLAAAALALLVWSPLAAAHVPADEPTSEERAAMRAMTFARPFALPAQKAAEPPIEATPRAQCGPGSRPEPSIQGRLPAEEISSGRADKGYQCNLTVLSRSGSTGGFRVHRYIDKAGRECAYYDTALLFPTNALSFSGEPTGVAVLDMSNPAKPVRTATLLTPAMQTPHESLNISIQRGVLAAVLGNPAAYPGGIDVYDISQDCRNPTVKAAAFPASPYGHESGMALDGLTFYPTSPGRSLSAVDISNQMLPRTLVNTEIGTHGMSTSDDGRRGYLSVGDGLAIVDLSDVQDRKPNPQIREISHLTWSNVSIPQIPIPVTIKGKPYIVEVDEYSKNPGGSVAAHGSVVGAARIIDISDEKQPRVVSNIRLAVHQPENRAAIAGDPGAQSPVQGYAGHYCNVPQRVEPGIVACSMIMSGLRVFDIRDPEKPKEIAYYMSPPSTISATGGPVIDERSNWAMSQPAFAPERGEIWYSDGNSGFYALKMDPSVWPFTRGSGSGSDCTDNRGFASVGVRSAPGGIGLTFKRRRQLPVRVDIFRVSDGRRVLRERRVATFANAKTSLRLRSRLRRGLYFARFRMLDGTRRFDVQRVAFEVTGGGAVRARPDHYQRESCQLLRTFKLERPAFGGLGRVPLRLSYRLLTAGQVTVTVSRGKKVVKSFTTRGADAGRTYRLALSSAKLPRGDYRVRVRAVSGDSVVSATLVARRL